MLDTFVSFEDDEKFGKAYYVEQYAKRVKSHLLSLFDLAGWTIRDYWELPDGYRTGIHARLYMPWLLLKTDWGMIRVGFRKRVIHIEWNDTNIQAPNLTEDKVTKDEYCIHAWTYPKALEYLEALHKHFKEYKAKKAGT